MDTASKPSKETLSNWSQDPNNWKWGVIYYNKQDPRIFPPKRISGLGWTINFANPKSVAGLIGIIALIAFVSILF